MTVLQHNSVTVLRCESATVQQSDGVTVLQYYCITVRQVDSVLQHEWKRLVSYRKKELNIHKLKLIGATAEFSKA